MKKTLRGLLAKGNTKQAIAELLTLTAHDADLRNQVVQLSARFAQYERQKSGNLEEPHLLTIELNRINEALLAIIGEFKEANLPELSEDGFADLEFNSTKSKSSKHSKFSRTRWSDLNDLKSWVALLTGLFGILTFYLKFCKNIIEDESPFYLVVYTHGQGGHQDIISLKHTKLVADFGGRREIAKINENGQNVFNEVPAQYRNKKISIGLQSTEGYVLKYPDSLYDIGKKPIYLAVKKHENWQSIKVIIIDEDGIPIPETEVFINGKGFATGVAPI